MFKIKNELCDLSIERCFVINHPLHKFQIFKPDSIEILDHHYIGKLIHFFISLI